MPDILIINDSASFTSSNSSSTAKYSLERSANRLRRQKSASQLTKWVSKRVSRASLQQTPQGSNLSEKNPHDLSIITTSDLKNPSLSSKGASVEKESNRNRTMFESVQEDVEVEKPAAVALQQQTCLYESYNAYCQDFTLSGPQRPKRMFDMRMCFDRDTEVDVEVPATSGIDGYQGNSIHLNPCECKAQSHSIWTRSMSTANVFASSESVSSSAISSIDNAPRESASRNSHTEERASLVLELADSDENNPTILDPGADGTCTSPRPPPQILTPSVWMERQRAQKERKSARQQRVWGAIQSCFWKTQGLRKSYRIE